MLKKKESGKGFIPIEKVKELKSKNLADVEIIQNLMKEGFSAEEIDQALVQFYNLPEEKSTEVTKEEKKELVAPLFVKLEKYKQILESLKELKASIELVKSSLNSLKEVQNLMKENLTIFENCIQNLEKKFVGLDSYFLRPPSYKEEEIEEAKDLEVSISQLKNQIEKLKLELQSVSK